MSLRIGLVYDLRTDYLAEGYAPEQVAEFDSEETIAAIEATIRSLGYAVERIGSARSLAAALVAGRRWDLVFNVAEGLVGRSREAQAPALLELYGVGYTFSDPLVCAATLDKAVAKRLVRDARLATPKFHVVRSLDDIAGVALEYPLFAKPLAEGTGKGIDDRCRIDSPAQLAEVCRNLLSRFAQPVLVEEFLPGREFTVGILGSGGEARVLGTMEIEVTQPTDARAAAGAVASAPGAGVGSGQSAIYSYESKERCEQLVRYSRVAAGPLKRKVEKLAIESYRVLECRDGGRVDIRCDRRGRPAFMEVNPLPGLHPTHSDLPMIATQEGMSYAELLGAIISSALARLGTGHEE